MDRASKSLSTPLLCFLAPLCELITRIEIAAGHREFGFARVPFGPFAERIAVLRSLQIERGQGKAREKGIVTRAS